MDNVDCKGKITNFLQFTMHTAQKSYKFVQNNIFFA